MIKFGKKSRHVENVHGRLTIVGATEIPLEKKDYERMRKALTGIENINIIDIDMKDRNAPPPSPWDKMKSTVTRLANAALFELPPLYKSLYQMRHERKKLGLTLKALAAKCEVSYTTIWNLENGQDDKVSHEIRTKVAKVLRVPSYALFTSELILARRNQQELHRLHLESVNRLVDIAKLYRVLTLAVFCPGLGFVDYKAANEILLAMGLEELGDLYHAGVTAEEAIDRMNRVAERTGLKPVELNNADKEVGKAGP